MSRRPVRRSILVAAAVVAPLLVLAPPANAALSETYTLDNCIDPGKKITATLNFNGGTPVVTLTPPVVITTLGLAATDELELIVKARTRGRGDHVSRGEIPADDPSIDGSEADWVNRKVSWTRRNQRTVMRAFELGATQYPHTEQEKEILVAAWGGCADD